MKIIERKQTTERKSVASVASGDMNEVEKMAAEIKQLLRRLYKRNRAVCHHAAPLMTKALQEAGYEAKSVWGYFWPVESYDLLQHWWTEVWIDSRLVIVDLTLDQMGFGPVCIGDKTPDYMTLEAAGERMLEEQRKWELRHGRDGQEECGDCHA